LTTLLNPGTSNCQSEKPDKETLNVNVLDVQPMPSIHQNQ